MIYTFANRTVGMVGNFDTATEIMTLVIQYLGGHVVPMTMTHFKPEVLVMGMNTSHEVIKDIEKYFDGPGTIWVYEGKINDHMPDDKLFSDIIDRVKQELPWGKHY